MRFVWLLAFLASPAFAQGQGGGFSVQMLIHVCTPDLKYCEPHPIRSSRPYGSSALCLEAIQRGTDDGTWARGAVYLNERPGYVLKFDCTPDGIVVVE